MRGSGPPRLVAATAGRVLGRDDFEDRLAALLEAGLPALWLRTGGGSDRAFLDLAARMRAVCDKAAAELWVGDRADVARIVGADVVQLPGAGLSIEGAWRVVGIGIRIGRSVHALETARDAIAAGVDHLVVGTMFETESHPGKRPEGPALLASVAGVAPGLPLYGIGGVTPDRVEPLVRAGATGVAAIGALWDAEDPAEAVHGFLAALEECGGRTLH